MSADVFVGECAVLHVVEEYLLHAHGGLAVVEEEVGLEVVFERAEVDVGRAAGAEGVVADEELAVVEAVLIEIHLYAGFDGLCEG